MIQRCQHFNYLSLNGRVWWCGRRGGAPEGLFILLLIDVPSITGAVCKLVETGSFFSLEIVQLCGLGVFVISAERQRRTT